MNDLAIALSEQSRSLLKNARKLKPIAVHSENLNISTLIVFDAHTGESDLIIGLNDKIPWRRWEPWEEVKHEHLLFEPNIEYIDIAVEGQLCGCATEVRKSERIMPCISDHESILISSKSPNAVQLNNAKIRNRTDPLYLESLEFCLRQPMKGIMDHWAKQLLTESQTREAHLAHLLRAYERSDV